MASAAEDFSLNAAVLYHAWKSPGESAWVNFYCLHDSFIADYPGICRFRIYTDQRLIRYYFTDVSRKESFAHLLLDNILPLYLSTQKKLILHASAVSGPKGLIAFIGKSGSGKSTLAYQLSAFFDFISDDFIVIQSVDPEVVGLGTYPAVRLWQQPKFGPSYRILDSNSLISDKLRLQLTASDLCSSAKGQRVQALIFPQYSDSLRPGEYYLEPVGGISAIRYILQNLFVLDPENKEVQTWILPQLSSIAEKVCSYTLVFGDIQCGTSADLITEIERL